MDFTDLPKSFSQKNLRKSDLLTDPFDQFHKWLEEAKRENITDSNAMTLATAKKSGKPSSRTVLLKHSDNNGLVFFTNYQSRKSKELEENPFAMVTFYWREITRQICVEGEVERITQEESADYFAKRTRGSQLGAWASNQDSVIASRQELDDNFQECTERFTDKEIPLPPFWGGFRLTPTRFEFWQAGKDRLHDRFQYTLKGTRWNIERLAP